MPKIDLSELSTGLKDSLGKYGDPVLSIIYGPGRLRLLEITINEYCRRIQLPSDCSDRRFNVIFRSACIELKQVIIEEALQKELVKQSLEEALQQELALANDSGDATGYNRGYADGSATKWWPIDENTPKDRPIWLWNGAKHLAARWNSSNSNWWILISFGSDSQPYTHYSELPEDYKIPKL